jgi:hypothetical protein
MGKSDPGSGINKKHPRFVTLHTPHKQFWPFLFKRIEDVEEVTAVHAEAEDEELAATHLHHRAPMRSHLTENCFIDSSEALIGLNPNKNTYKDYNPKY